MIRKARKPRRWGLQEILLHHRLYIARRNGVQIEHIRYRDSHRLIFEEIFDPRDAARLELGIREFAQSAGMPLIAYVKDELNFGADRDAGLDTIAWLVDSGVCVAIKYAVVRELSASLRRAVFLVVDWRDR